MLETLNMANIRLSSRAAITLFNIIKKNNKLKKLDIDNSNITNITDDVSSAITTALKKNSCLIKLYMNDNSLTDEAILNIVNELKDNDTLELLGVPIYPQDIKKKISFLQEVINEKRESRGCQVKLVINYSLHSF